LDGESEHDDPVVGGRQPDVGWKSGPGDGGDGTVENRQSDQVGQVGVIAPVPLDMELTRLGSEVERGFVVDVGQARVRLGEVGLAGDTSGDVAEGSLTVDLAEARMASTVIAFLVWRQVARLMAGLWYQLAEVAIMTTAKVKAVSSRVVRG